MYRGTQRKILFVETPTQVDIIDTLSLENDHFNNEKPRSKIKAKVTHLKSDRSLKDFLVVVSDAWNRNAAFTFYIAIITEKYGNANIEMMSF